MSFILVPFFTDPPFLYVTVGPNSSSIPGPYYNIGPFSIQTLSINFIQHCFCDLGKSFRGPQVSFTSIFSRPRKNMIKLTLVPQNAYLGSRVTKTVMYILRPCFSTCQNGPIWPNVVTLMLHLCTKIQHQCYNIEHLEHVEKHGHS
jgi:hypothetical protein